MKKAESKYAEARREAERFRENSASAGDACSRVGGCRAQIAEDKAHVAEAIRRRRTLQREAAEAQEGAETVGGIQGEVLPGAQPRGVPAQLRATRAQAEHPWPKFALFQGRVEVPTSSPSCLLRRFHHKLEDVLQTEGAPVW